MKLSDDETELLLDELLQMEQTQFRQPGDIDAYQYAERTGLTSRQALTHLDDLAKQGKLQSPGMVYDREKRRRVKVWRRV